VSPGGYLFSVDPSTRSNGPDGLIHARQPGRGHRDPWVDRGELEQRFGIIGVALSGALRHLGGRTDQGGSTVLRLFSIRRMSLEASSDGRRGGGARGAELSALESTRQFSTGAHSSHGKHRAVQLQATKHERIYDKLPVHQSTGDASNL
jgi:hypothetical protein